jgi:hypothetical protein
MYKEKLKPNRSVPSHGGETRNFLGTLRLAGLDLQPVSRPGIAKGEHLLVQDFVAGLIADAKKRCQRVI